MTELGYINVIYINFDNNIIKLRSNISERIKIIDFLIPIGKNDILLYYTLKLI